MKRLLILLFLFLVLGFLAWANSYLSRRFVWYFSVKQTFPVYLIFAFLTVFMIAGIAVFGNNSSTFGSLLYKTAAIIMGFLLYLLLSVALADLVRLVINAEPKIYGIAVLLLTLAVCVSGIWNASRVRTTRIMVPVKGLTHEIRTMHLTDIHLGHFRGRDFLQHFLDESRREQVDVIFITGDLFDGRKQVTDEVFGLFRQVKIPVYFVEGNHERYTGVKLIKKKLREAGVRVLENEVVWFEGLQVVGLNDLQADRQKRDMHARDATETMQEVLSRLSVDKDKPAVLLHHSPKGIRYARKQGIDLYLAGHTHGGQLFPLTFIAAMVHTYNKGFHDYQGTRIFVSQGAGTFGPPMRVGTYSEIAVITLVPDL